MRHRALALIAAVLLLGFLPGSTLGSTLDQHNTATPTVGFGSDILAQSVTAGVTGKLARVDLMVQDTSVGGGTLKVQIEGIERATGWPPDNSVLAQGSAHISNMGWYSFALSPAISLLAGGHFCIVVDVHNSQMIESSGDTYSGGQLWHTLGPSWKSPPGGPYDLDFKTYMNTPAPTPKPSKPNPTSGATTKPAPTSTASATTTLAPTATPSPTSSVASVAPSGTAEVAAGSTPAPTASATQVQPSSAGTNAGTDWTLPAVAAVVVLLVLATGVWFIVRRRRRPSS